MSTPIQQQHPLHRGHVVCYVVVLPCVHVHVVPDFAALLSLLRLPCLWMCFHPYSVDYLEHLSPNGCGFPQLPSSSPNPKLASSDGSMPDLAHWKNRQNEHRKQEHQPRNETKTRRHIIFHLVVFFFFSRHLDAALRFRCKIAIRFAAASSGGKGGLRRRRRRFTLMRGFPELVKTNSEERKAC